MRLKKWMILVGYMCLFLGFGYSCYRDGNGISVNARGRATTRTAVLSTTIQASFLVARMLDQPDPAVSVKIRRPLRVSTLRVHRHPRRHQPLV